MQRLFGNEDALPYPVQADVIAPEIAHHRDVDEDQRHHDHVQRTHETGNLGSRVERDERPDLAGREKEQKRDDTQQQRRGNKAESKDDPVEGLVLGCRDLQPFAVDVHVGALAQQLVGQVVRPFRDRVLRTGPAAPDRAYGHVSDDRSGGNHEPKTEHKKEIPPPQRAVKNRKTRGGQIDPEKSQGRNQRDQENRADLNGPSFPAKLRLLHKLHLDCDSLSIGNYPPFASDVREGVRTTIRRGGLLVDCGLCIYSPPCYLNGETENAVFYGS